VVRDSDGAQIVLELKKGSASKPDAKQQCQNYMYFLSLENGKPIEKGFVIGFPTSEEESASASE
jgi:CRISPR/Cas system-associated exonuclease Cas4 (RecB family)